jgi:hypothetical protein
MEAERSCCAVATKALEKEQQEKSQCHARVGVLESELMGMNLRFEQVKQQLEATKRNLQVVEVEHIKELEACKRQLTKKFGDVQEENERIKEELMANRRREMKVHQEITDLHHQLELREHRCLELERKQKQVDAQMMRVQAAVAEESLHRERLQRERDESVAEKLRMDRQFQEVRYELELVREKNERLTQQLNDLTSRGNSDDKEAESAFLLERTPMELRRRVTKLEQKMNEWIVVSESKEQVILSGDLEMLPQQNTKQSEKVQENCRMKKIPERRCNDNVSASPEAMRNTFKREDEQSRIPPSRPLRVTRGIGMDGLQMRNSQAYDNVDSNGRPVGEPPPIQKWIRMKNQKSGKLIALELKRIHSEKTHGGPENLHTSIKEFWKWQDVLANVQENSKKKCEVDMEEVQERTWRAFVCKEQNCTELENTRQELFLEQEKEEFQCHRRERQTIEALQDKMIRWAKEELAEDDLHRAPVGEPPPSLLHRQWQLRRTYYKLRFQLQGHALPNTPHSRFKVMYY